MSSNISSVDITYPGRSRFTKVCEAAICKGNAELKAGGVVQIDLGEGGYDGSVIVTIHSGDRLTFGTDWERADPTRFPARIKAAAAALLHCRCEGRFNVTHSGGSLTIRAV